MKIIAVLNYEALSCCAADIVEAQLRQKPDTCLGTVTGQLARGHVPRAGPPPPGGGAGAFPASARSTRMNMPVSPARIRSPIVTIWRSISSAPAASRRSIRRSRRAMQPPRRPSAAVMKHSVAPTRPICRSSASATPATSASTSLPMIFRSSRTLWTLHRRRLPRMLTTLTSRTPCRGRLLRSVSVC